MEWKHLPLRNPQPDVNRFVDVLLGRKKTNRPPLVEYIVDEHVYRPVVTGLLGREWVPYGDDHPSRAAFLDNFIALWHGMGYDFVRYEQGYAFPGFHISAKDPVVGSEKMRSWADEHQGHIASWEDFERFPWPRFEDIDFFNLDYLSTHLPEGMGFITSHGGGVFEHVSFLFSIEGLWMAVCEQPDLVKAVADRVGELMERYYRHLLDLPNLAVIFPGDDMGYKTGTLISPDDLRRYFLPWHKRFAAMTHEKGLPYFLHSCGNLIDIMDDLIDDVRIDGKHSFEDIILPVQDFQQRFGDRIACLGGVDLNILAGPSPEAVRQH
ncbi:MAG: uroporphyrinogen decarboxylase family protein, partial [FCB group bacterium]|nr:uroporphyrinogen decarboxylase family protein [FCB group bacterium]